MVTLSVIVTDDSDVNWWKGTNHRGEGLFPANFVTTDLDAEPEGEEKKRRRSVQFNEEVEVKTVQEDHPTLTEISEGRIDQVMLMLNEADPTSPESDPLELGPAEDQVNAMGPLIDAELESIDRRHAQLTRISTELVDALNLYHQLMHDAPAAMPAGYGMMGAPPMPHASMGAYPGYGSMPAQPQPMGYPSYPAAGAPDGRSNGTTYPTYPPQTSNAPPPDPAAFVQPTMDPAMASNSQMYAPQVAGVPMPGPPPTGPAAPPSGAPPVDLNNSQHFSSPLPQQ